MHRRASAAALAACLVGAACAAAPSLPPQSADSIGPASSQAATASAAASAAATAMPTSALVAADLDGVLTTAELAHRLPLAVSIDDARAARPQSGFNAASIVYHAPADGYEARYLLVFQEADATDIGPVRSSRIYLAEWAAELHAGFAHYGGDKLTLGWLKGVGLGSVTNIDGLGAGNPAFHRISSRAAPHNAYTATASLWAQAVKLGGAATADASVHLRPFRDDTPASGRPASQTISVPYRTVTVGYAYDATTDAYRRSLDGKPHIDPMDGAQVTARTVLVLYMPFRTSNTIEPGHNRPVLTFIGHGTAQVFSEGRLVDATWSKAGPFDPTIILGPDGEELSLVRGRIFVEVVPTETKVSVRP